MINIDNIISSWYNENGNQPGIFGIYEAAHVPEEQKVIRQRQFPNGLYSVVVESCLQEADEINRNSRTYAFNLLRKAMQHPMILECMRNKTWYGEGDHPMDKRPERLMHVDQLRAFGSVDRIWWDNKSLYGEIESMLDTSAGKAYAGAVLQGRKTGYSMRGFGPSEIKTENVSGNQRRVVHILDLFIRCYDWVQYPSHQNAYQKNYKMRSGMMESIEQFAESFASPIDSENLTEDSCIFPMMSCKNGNEFENLVESFTQCREFKAAITELGLDAERIISITTEGNLNLHDPEVCQGDLKSVVVRPTEYFRENVLSQWFNSTGFGNSRSRTEAFEHAASCLNVISRNDEMSNIDKIRRFRGYISRAKTLKEIKVIDRLFDSVVEDVKVNKVFRNWVDTYGRVELRQRMAAS